MLKFNLNFQNQSLQDDIKVIIRTELRPKSVKMYTLKNLNLQRVYKGCNPVCSNLTIYFFGLLSHLSLNIYDATQM